MERERLLIREQEARTAAEAANRAKDEFLAMLGHELRNPLGAISNAAHLLDHPRTTPEVANQARGIIGRQVDHLVRMTDDLLDAARAITGKIALHKKPLDLAAAVAATTALGTMRLRAEGHKLVEDFEHVWIHADPTRIEQIVTNLVENALKYTPPGGTVRIAVRKENDDAVLRVADNGVGMSPELTTHVFELFVQGNRELDRPHGGLGIGLTLVRRLAELHGGSVEAKSAGAGEGSEFVVRLPAIPDPVVENGTVTTTQPAAPRDILIIEDNDDLRESLCALLEYSGHRVRSAADGITGLEALLSSPPEIALVDVGLPKLDGYEIARRVRAMCDEKGSGPLLVALTGYGRPEDRKRALDAGFDAHLVKPIDEKALEELLARGPKK
jgi:two-component system, sensor histidine kinase